MEEGNDPARERAEKMLGHWQGIAEKHRKEVATAETNIKMLRQILGNDKPKGLTKNETEPAALPDLSETTLKESVTSVLGTADQLTIGDLCDKITQGGYKGSKKSLRGSVCSILSENINSKDPKYKRVDVGVYALA